MTPEQWARVKQIFEAALRAPREERAGTIAAAGEPPEIRAEVESLLAVYEDAPDFLEGVSPLTGRRIGSWRLVREIGRGGMGVVWEAERADREYEQKAAVKLLPCGLLSTDGIARFREERQILARLNHPGIARLLDGGTAEDGSPYLVMEYIEGQRLDQWCSGRNLSARERLKLFLVVAAAVEYAHRHLVVHRDLKPANILVTPEGAPKLLDFGIARLLGSTAEVTGTGARRLTPDYASPEQVRGESATTASDVYSLGVLLYVLLAGGKPYGQQSGNPVEIMRAVCEQEPPPPSAASGRAELRGDLDAVILQALRKDPEERYPSVHALAEDIRAWLEGRPVTAHPRPWWQRGAKLVRRHRTQSAAIALALLSLIAGSAVSLWQAHDARRQRSRAESRFREVRRFSRSLLFELHQAIRDLPGATPARQLLLARATEFLDALEKDSADDASLQVELAEGYRRLGHVQGGALSANLGRTDDAIESFRKAARLAEQALVQRPGDADAEIVLSGAYDDLASAYLLRKHDLAQADAWERRHRELLTRMERGHPNDNRVRQSLAVSYSAVGYYCVQRNDLAGAAQYYRKAIEAFSALERSGSVSGDWRAQYSFALKRLGAIRIAENSLDEAEKLYRAALALEDAELRAQPGNIELRVDRTFTLSDLALIAKRRNDLPRAAAAYREVVGVRKAALDADPKNIRFMELTASGQIRLARVYSSAGQHAEAIDLCREAVRWQERAAASQTAREPMAGRIALAGILLEAAGSSAPRTARRAWLEEAAAVLDRAAPFVSQLERSGSRNDQTLFHDWREVCDRLRVLTAAR